MVQPDPLAGDGPCQRRGVDSAVPASDDPRRTPMLLYVMRHGPAVAGLPGGRDRDRELSVDGRADVRRAASELERRGERIGRVLSSPLVRAVQTAELVAELLTPGRAPELRDELEPGGASYDLVRELLRGGGPSCLLVSHAPDVSDLVLGLTGRRAGAFAPATIAALDVEADTASLRWVVLPP